MGLLDEVGKMLGGAQSGGASDMLILGQQLLSQNGGLDGLLKKFQSGGLGDIVSSWVGTGENLPVTAQQIQSVLGSEQVGAIASKLGVDPQQVASQIAQVLPGLVSKLTPNGQMPEGGDLLAKGADMLKGFLK